MKTFMIHFIIKAVGAHIHSIDFPVRGLENSIGQMMADKAVNTEDQNFHGFPNYCRGGTSPVSLR
jgi:hypothetical protein